jgi:hypothetical protein
MRFLTLRLTYANVMATLGGVGYAATNLPANSVGTKQLRGGAVTPAKLSKGAKASLAGPAGPQGVAGPKGDRGEKGDQGAPGTPATTLWASFDETHKLLASSGVASVEAPSAGRLAVTFDRSLDACSFSATIGEPENGLGAFGYATVQPELAAPGLLQVETRNAKGEASNQPVYVTVSC